MPECFKLVRKFSFFLLRKFIALCRCIGSFLSNYRLRRGHRSFRRTSLFGFDAAFRWYNQRSKYGNAQDGYDAAYGARPLKRLIQKQVGDRLAMALLEGKAGEGDTVTLDVVDGAFELS